VEQGNGRLRAGAFINREFVKGSKVPMRFARMNAGFFNKSKSEYAVKRSARQRVLTILVTLLCDNR
jgi:hypothetical protein